MRLFFTLFAAAACAVLAGCFDHRGRPADATPVTSLAALAATNRAEVVRLCAHLAFGVMACRLTRHIGTRYYRTAIICAVKNRIVRDKRFAVEHFLNNRMASLVYLYDRLCGHLRADIVIFERRLSKRAENIELRHCRRCTLNAGKLCTRALSDIVKNLVFELIKTLRNQYPVASSR